MPDSIRQRHEALQLGAVLERYPGLRIVPSADERLVMKGQLDFHVVGPSGETIEDSYAIEVTVRPGFPEVTPVVRETGGRIPRDFHKLEGGALCVAAPTEIRMRLRQSPTLLTFVEGFVIPYLYNYSHREKHGTLPYGELAHGSAGLRQHLAAMFGVRHATHPEEFLRVAGMKKRSANKQPCPCGSGRRLGKCHNRTVNRWRRQYGRRWFAAEYERIADLLERYEKPVAPPPLRRAMLL
jgi:hypothetical protein